MRNQANPIKNRGERGGVWKPAQVQHILGIITLKGFNLNSPVCNAGYSQPGSHSLLTKKSVVNTTDNPPRYLYRILPPKRKTENSTAEPLTDTVPPSGSLPHFLPD